ncbi:MAG TPA: enoyl-CoA hydratase/isomerase family protein [Streptosporangiaceae bacterium]|jgi:enoyl-CoA hydratase/carnithine racemase
MPHPYVLVERLEAGHLRVALSRPERRNALDPGMVVALTEALSADPDAVVVLGSATPGMFCAGADLSIPDAERAAVSDLLYDCFELMITRPGPVIAAVGGAAVGGGVQLACAADLRVAGPAARLRWTGPPGAGLAVGAWILPELVGRGRALELIMSGRWVEAAEAVSLGLASRVEPDPDQAAAELAGELARRGGSPFGAAKTVASTGGLRERLRAERAVNRAAWQYPGVAQAGEQG